MEETLIAQGITWGYIIALAIQSMGIVAVIVGAWVRAKTELSHLKGLRAEDVEHFNEKIDSASLGMNTRLDRFESNTTRQLQELNENLKRINGNVRNNAENIARHEGEHRGVNR